MTGGLGGAVAEYLSSEYPVPVSRIGAQDVFGQVGTLEFLMKEYRLLATDIAQAARAVIKKKHEGA